MKKDRRVLFGKLVRRKRKAMGLTQIPFAERAGIEQGTLSKVEAGLLGGPGMGVGVVAGICRVAGIPVEKAVRMLVEVPART